MRDPSRVLRPAVTVMATLPALLLFAAATAGAQSLPSRSCSGALLAENAARAPRKVQPAVPNAAAATIPLGIDSTLVTNLKQGGYVLFFRHAATNWNERDQAQVDFSNRSLQRNLSEMGQREAAAIGQSLRALEIPVEKVLASPMWRCRDTAQFAFGEYDTTGDLYWKGPKFREARVKMLSTAPAPGKNLVLVGHQDQLLPLVPGLKRDQLGEGDVLVIRPLGKDKFQIVRQVTPFEWARLAQVELPVPTEPPPQGTMPALPDSVPRGSPKSTKGVQ